MADDTGCPIIVGDGVYGQVVQTMASMQEKASVAFQTSITAMGELGTFKVPTLVFNAQFVPDTNWTAYVRPHAPTDLVVSDVDFAQVPAPPTFGSTEIAFTAPPTDNTVAPIIPDHVAPNTAIPTKEFTDPVLPDLVVPTAPTFAFPDEPALNAITLPAPITVPHRTFDGVRPNLGLYAPANTFSFTPQQYVSDLLDRVRGRVSSMLDGGTGLPLAVVTALRDRAYAANDVEDMRAVQQAIEEYGARGFNEPSGILNKRVTEVRQNNQNQRNSLSRDIYIEDQKIAVENLRFAVTNGIALESKLMDIFIEMSRLELEAAKTAVDVVIRIFDSEVRLANLELDQFKADAEVFRALIQADLAEVEVYKAQIDAQRLVGELNQQLVAIYREKVSAILAKAQVYEAQVRAVEAQSRINVSIVEAKRVEIQAFAEQIHAYSAQWDAYGKQIESDVSKARIYEISENVYATRAKVWADINTSKIDQKRLTLDQDKLSIEAWKAQLDKITFVIDSQLKRVDSEVRVYEALIEKYKADASIEQVAVDSNAKQIELYVSQQRATVDTAIETARINVGQLNAETQVLLEAKKTVASVGAQLSAGAMSAQSAHASIGSSLSQGQSCSTSFSFNTSIQE
jgi:hypothetical protein